MQKQLCENHKKVSQNTCGRKILLVYYQECCKSSSTQNKSWTKHEILFCYPSYYSLLHYASLKTVGIIRTVCIYYNNTDILCVYLSSLRSHERDVVAPHFLHWCEKLHLVSCTNRFSNWYDTRLKRKGYGSFSEVMLWQPYTPHKTKGKSIQHKRRLTYYKKSTSCSTHLIVYSNRCRILLYYMKVSFFCVV